MKTVSHITAFALVILMTFANLNVNAQTAFELPFFEDWQSWHFETNQWLTDGDNWQKDTQNGNDAPSAKFHRTPILTDYSSALTSNSFDASLLSVGRIFLNFDLKLTDNNETGTEFMHFQVFDGTDWIKLDSVSNTGSFEWTAYTYEITNWAIGNYFQIRFLAKGENSMDMLDWHIDNIEVYRECDRPTELAWELYWNGNDNYGVELSWEAPVSVFQSGGWQHYDSGDNYGAISLTNGGLVLCSIKWDAGMLNKYNADTIEKIKFFVNDGFEYLIIKVWTGENASNLVYSDTIENVLTEEWNEHILNENIIINSSLEYWVGYEMKSYTSEYTMGHDQGPAIAGFGDKISLNGAVWDNLSDFGKNYNWNIQMFVDAGPVQNPETLLGFNVFRSDCGGIDFENIAFSDFEEGQGLYIFQDPGAELCWEEVFCYKVNALWGDDTDTCISPFAKGKFDYENADSVCVLPINIAEKQLLNDNTIILYPIPTTTTLNIKSESKLKTVTIFNLFGQKVKEFDVTHKKELQIDVSKLKSGVYLLRAFDGETIISSKFIIQ